LFVRYFAYLKYFLRAKNAHGLHSPFLYDFYNQCLSIKNHAINKEVESKRKAYLQNKEKVLSYNSKTKAYIEREIADIAKTSLSTRKFSRFLACLSNYLECNCILETGTSLGINSFFLAKETKAEIISIEKNQYLEKYHQDIFGTVEHVEIVYGDWGEFFSKIMVTRKPELIFLDADHRSSSILQQIDIIKANIDSVKAIVIHDIYWSRDMQQCWKRINESNDWSCTVDIFHAGIIFPKLEIPKQNFTIKF